MTMKLAILLGLILMFTSLHFAIVVLASQCLAEIQGNEAEDRVKQAIPTTKPSAFLGSGNTFGDGHPMDSRVWFALREAWDLPEAVQRKARTIGLLYEIERLVFAGAFIWIVFMVLHT